MSTQDRDQKLVDAVANYKVGGSHTALAIAAREWADAGVAVPVQSNEKRASGNLMGNAAKRAGKTLEKALLDKLEGATAPLTEEETREQKEADALAACYALSQARSNHTALCVTMDRVTEVQLKAAGTLVDMAQSRLIEVVLELP